VLVHPTSFPGRFGIGDLGPGARLVLDFLAAGRQRLWQVLPLGPTGFGESPYAAFSAFAGNHLLIAPEGLAERGWLGADELAAAPALADDRVDFDRVRDVKLGLFRAAHRRFRAGAGPEQRAEIEAFRAANASWLEDYALFMALKAAHDGAPWTSWEPDLAARRPEALAEAGRVLAEDVDLHRFLQWVFVAQWEAVRAEARRREIAVVGDVAIFLAHDSADVWAHRELFCLDGRGEPTAMAGVPPDYFSRSGQLWGNPLYRWNRMAGDGYAWWIERVRAALRLADVLRLDHFRGFEAYWEVPAGEETAERGRWVRGPGMRLFRAIRRALGEVPIIAEDLGEITDAVRRLRAHAGFPGMRVLQFAFGAGAGNDHLPHLYPHDTAVYTGTHDNDTTRGWFASRDPREREHALRYAASDGREFNWDLIRLALASVADTAIMPLQDVLGLGSEARMNTPGRAAGNWAWRCAAEQLTAEHSARLAALTELYGR
jgi:4-alpha-glucanotransferase